MFDTVSARLKGWYNPSLPAITAVLASSTLLLALFLDSPDFANPYYLFGVAATVFTVVAAATILVVERLR